MDTSWENRKSLGFLIKFLKDYDISYHKNITLIYFKIAISMINLEMERAMHVILASSLYMMKLKHRYEVTQERK